MRTLLCMNVFIWWSARTGVTVGAWFVLWNLGWQHWTSVIGAVAIAWMVTYLFFGSLYDSAATQMDRVLGRTVRRTRGEDEQAEDAEVSAPRRS